jgi:hypothetical protein
MQRLEYSDTNHSRPKTPVGIFKERVPIPGLIWHCSRSGAGGRRLAADSSNDDGLTINFHSQPVITKILRNHISGRYAAYRGCSRDCLRLAFRYVRPSDERLRGDGTAAIAGTTGTGIIFGSAGGKAKRKGEGRCSQ